MQQISSYLNQKLAATTFIYPDGEIKIIMRDDKGGQFCKSQRPEDHAGAFRPFAELPVATTKSGLRMIKVEWCDLYAKYFPHRPLPKSLERLAVHNHKTMQKAEQLALGF